jgi:hypothetical protein
MITVTAKVKCTGKTQTEPGDDGQVNLTFGADYEDGRNAEWAKYTPGLSLTMGVKASVAEHFEQGGAYTLTFTPEQEEGQAR